MKDKMRLFFDWFSGLKSTSKVFFICCAIVALVPPPARCEIPNIQDIVIHPDVLKIGGTARLLCMVANVVPGVTVFWSKVDTQNVISADGVIKADLFDEQSHIRKYDILVYKSDATSGVNIYELIIHKLQMLDGGLYKCHLYISGHVSSSDTGRFARLTIVVPPRINLEVMKPVVTTYLNEPEVKLLCKASGQPAPNITWSRYSGIDAQGNKNIRFKDGAWIVYGETLVLKNIEQSDAGLYRCAAKNNVDPDDIEMAQYDIQLQVHYRPTSTASQREIGQAPNKNYYSHLDCRIVGFPAPEMYWFKVKPTKQTTLNSSSNPFGALDIINQLEGKSLEDCWKIWEVDDGPLKQTSELFLSHHQQPDSMDSWLFRLEIKNVKNAHYGYYLCSAQNSLGASCSVVYFYETTHCQGTWCPNPLQPAQQLGASSLSAPSLVTLLLLSLIISAAVLVGSPLR